MTTQRDVKKEFARMEAEGFVRFKVEADEEEKDYSVVNLEGWTSYPTYPKLSPDTNPDMIKKEQEKFRRRLVYEGVWCILTQYRTSCGWEDAASVSPFIGDDWKDTVYVENIKRIAIDAYNAQVHCVLCHQSIKPNTEDNYKSQEPFLGPFLDWFQGEEQGGQTCVIS